MPLPDFLKRKKSANQSKESRNDSETGKVSGLPLENVSEELFTDSLSNFFSLDPSQRTNGLAKSFSEVLSNPNALGYFIQFMDSRSSVSLVKFCLDVLSFKASADLGKNSYSCNGDDEFESNDFGHFQSASDADFGHFQASQDDQVINDCDKLHSSCDEVHDEKSAKTKKVESVREIVLEANGVPDLEKERCPTSPSTESVDSGILVSQSDPSPVNGCGNNNLVNGVTNNNNNDSQVDVSQNLTPEEQALINLTKDALAIYQRYVAPESPMEIEFPLEVKNSIVTGICSESGSLDPKCFDSALEFVKSYVESRFFADFLQSEFNAKHEVDVLSQDGGRNVSIMDILENDVLLFHFTEFLDNSEGRKFSCILEFWISGTNFRQSSMGFDDTQSRDVLRNDAVAIYDKFVSLQASAPLGFSSAIRSRIEEQICSADGHVSPTCFDEALQLVVRVLHMRYVQKFINSALFKNYLTELATIISSASTPTSRLRRGDSMSSLNTSSSECNVSISAQNTLLASSSSFHRKFEKADPNFLDLCAESDHLWKRKQSQLTNIGRVNSLGRYTSHFEAPPDISTTSHSSGSKLSRAVRRMMTNAEVEKSKEELAWQMAGMIVKDVTTRSSAPIANCSSATNGVSISAATADS